jgi:hypothetical protein
MCALRLAGARSLGLVPPPFGPSARYFGRVHPPFGRRALLWARVPSVPQARDMFGICALRSACARSLGHVALRLPRTGSRLKPQILDWKPQSIPRNPKLSLWHVHPPFGMCARRYAWARSLGNVRPPFGMRVLPWARVPSDSHPRTPLGLNALRLARARYLGHVRTPFCPRALPWARAHSVWPARATLGTCALRLACMLSLWKPQILHGNPKSPVEEPKSSIGNPKLTQENINSPLGMCALRLTRARSLGHVRHPFGTHALILA